MTLQKLMGYIRRAAQDYGMIQAGDRIAVGVSGGKDSMSLLLGLAAMRAYLPEKYELEALTVSLNATGADFSRVTKLCDEIGVRHTIIESNIAEVVFDIRKENNPCSLCAKMRKGALNPEAVRLGCNKVAYAHNRDDVIQTFFLSLFYEGRIGAFQPVTRLDKHDLTVIRPLMYVPEKSVIGFVRENGVPIVKNPCPTNGNTKREEMKDMIREYRTRFKSFDEKVFGAIKRSGIDGWKNVPDGRRYDGFGE
ncbi:MAG: tRNA 2-thiocytidine biosynthesis TtcA family protein [Defluviitaleaceae bacterium]|nr:tRNA 2-thiocytidine biosynthesis TtcA family protein [Defluviitaleaceae bacterium]